MGEVTVDSLCHNLLDMRNFTGARSLVKMSKQTGKDWHKLDQVEAICDVIIAAENRLPNGFMDYYGMIRVTRLGPVVLDDFKRLMKLLDGTCNGFPSSQEAAQHALQAWSLLSKPIMKARYDFAVSALDRETHVALRGRGRGRRGNGRGKGVKSCRGDGGSVGGGGNDRSGMTSGGKGCRAGGFCHASRFFGSGGEGSGGGFFGEGNRYGGSSVEGCMYGGESDGEESDGRFDGGEGKGDGFGGSGGGNRGKGGGVDKGKRKVETFMRICPCCLTMDECETRGMERCSRCNKVSIGIHAPTKMIPFPLPEKRESLFNHRVGMFQLGFPSFLPKEQNPNQNAGRETDHVVVVTPDDDDDDDDGDGNEEIVTMARAAKLRKVNGGRVKLIPLKKKTRILQQAT